MNPFPMLLSCVVVVRNESASLQAELGKLSGLLQSLAADYELIVVDNGSTDDSPSALGRLASETGLPNLQVYLLTKEVDADTAAWVGVESALGDCVAVVSPREDDAGKLAEMLECAANGTDVVFAVNEARPARGLLYEGAARIFNRVYRAAGGLDLDRDAPRFRVLSKRVVNFILQHPRPELAYRLLPATAGFARATFAYRTSLPVQSGRPLLRGLGKANRLLVSTTHAPMRLVTSLSLFGALANVLYSAYVLAIFLFKEDVAPGWVSLSLQQSGMFLLISLVLLVLGEYILQVARLSSEGPPYHVAREFTSARLLRRERLNVTGPGPGEP